MQRACAAALKGLAHEVAPHAAVARTDRARGLASAGPQWQRMRQRLLDGHAIWGAELATLHGARAVHRRRLMRLAVLRNAQVARALVRLLAWWESTGELGAVNPAAKVAAAIRGPNACGVHAAEALAEHARRGAVLLHERDAASCRRHGGRWRGGLSALGAALGALHRRGDGTATATRDGRCERA